ncbi:MAG TPA: lytic transglycosylase domain-containing protein [bacterium]|nr:lytic transglycosylase domain-containing protein [bacterium]
MKPSKHEFVLGDSRVQIEARELAKRQEESQKEQAQKLALASRDTVSREKRVYVDPTDFEAIYEQAGQQFGVDPKLLRAIHVVETGASGSTSRSSYAGATGPMQFLPSTFRRHAVDGNGDGVKDITNVEDAIFSAAKYLVDCGYPNVKQALWGYNPSYAYYNKVMSRVN